ncbi:DedA family protein [Sphingomonas faeni]|uniref:DedA family protein n=1 Tax=Sphingomonas faeni TaxID=185950 RepID=UPI00334A81FB
MTDQLLELLTTYGLPALFGAMVLAAAGLPFPSSLTLIAMGSFVAQGELSFWPVVLSGAGGAVLGDQIGYAFGRYGGRPLLAAVTTRIGDADRVAQAETYSRKWAGWGIFFSRWLIGPLGPWINVTSGLTRYPGDGSSCSTLPANCSDFSYTSRWDANSAIRFRPSRAYSAISPGSS